MKLAALLLATALGLTVTSPARADMFSASSGCSKPYKPYRFEDKWALEQFQNDVQRYKRCIEDFVDDQREEARNHQEAADEAIEEWNSFVRYELN